jgi:hypothetical protein
MTSTLGGDDEAHDFSEDDKAKLEKAALRKEGDELRKKGKIKERQKKLDSANEISCQKSKRAHQ